MTTVYLIRHGECQGNREKRFRGRHDFPLNENGRLQAQALARALQHVEFHAIYTSPLSRCRETAECIAAGRVPVREVEGLINIRLGEWETLPQAEVARRWPQRWHLWRTYPEKLHFPGMEPIAQVQQRSVQAFWQIVNGHPDQTVAMVSHKVVLKALIAGLLEIPEPYFWKIHMDTAAYSILEYSPERGICLMQLNQNIHLDNFIREDLE